MIITFQHLWTFYKFMFSIKSRACSKAMLPLFHFPFRFSLISVLERPQLLKRIYTLDKMTIDKACNLILHYPDIHQLDTNIETVLFSLQNKSIPEPILLCYIFQENGRSFKINVTVTNVKLVSKFYIFKNDYYHRK